MTHRDTGNGTRTWAIALVALAATCAGARAAAPVVLQFTEPFAQASASDVPDHATIPVNDWQMAADFTMGSLVQARYVLAGSGRASAQAAASLTDDHGKLRFGLVTSRTQGENAAAAGMAMMFVDLSDPQHRDQVMVDVEFKAAANVPGAGHASWYWRFDHATGEPGEVTIDGGSILRIVLPDGASSSSRPIFPVFGGWAQVNRATPDDPGLAEFEGYVLGHSAGYRQLHQATAKTEDHGAIALPPGPYVVQIQTGASGGALAVADPVIQPDPSNPDVVVTIHGAADDTPRSPLFGMTAGDLAAAGFDPTPFTELGFLDTPGSTTTTTPDTTTTTTATVPESTTTTTTTDPGTTTTVPPDPPCPATDDAGRLGCLCGGDVGGTACVDPPPPAAAVRLFGRACTATARGIARGPGRSARRLLARAAADFARTLRFLRRPQVARTLSPSCRAALTTDLGEAAARARRLAEGS